MQFFTIPLSEALFWISFRMIYYLDCRRNTIMDQDPGVLHDQREQNPFPRNFVVLWLEKQQTKTQKIQRISERNMTIFAVINYSHPGPADGSNTTRHTCLLKQGVHTPSTKRKCPWPALINNPCLRILWQTNPANTVSCSAMDHPNNLPVEIGWGSFLSSCAQSVVWYCFIC